MKATFEYNLPEEEAEVRQLINCGNLWSALWEFDNRLRSIVKHGTDQNLDEETVEEVRSMFHSCLGDHDITL
jgi:hypothetical protein